ncbi:hypothetical protein Bca101_053572 [Brassica carinata]
MHVEGFALNVFAEADKQDRAGRADLSTLLGKLLTLGKPSEVPQHPLPPSSYPSTISFLLPLRAASHYPAHYQNGKTLNLTILLHIPHLLLSSTTFTSSRYSSSNGLNNIVPVLEPAPSPAQKYHYDSSYQTRPEKIAQRHTRLLDSLLELWLSMK